MVGFYFFRTRLPYFCIFVNQGRRLPIIVVLNQHFMSTYIDGLITKIRELQQQPDRHFPGGLIPTYRTNRSLGYCRKDTTMFFPAIITFTLQSIREQVTHPETKATIDSITKDVVATYSDFQNKDGLKTYNFWKTKPSRHFPNGSLFRHFEHFRIPDDSDDTAMVYLTTSPTREELLWLKEKLAQHANGTKRVIRNTYPEYRQLRAYSTWFGKNMYIEFDACVLNNLLYCIFEHGLPLNQHDEDSLTYIRSVIETDRYRTEPFRCAHQYPRTPLIIYHVARLIARFNPPQLSAIVPKLIADAQEQLKICTHPLDRVILSTSLMRLDQPTERIAIEQLQASDFDGFYFFIAGLLTAYENKLLYRLAPLPVWHMRWECEAHNWTLLAEYETLWQKQ
jgi:hypothetical protein